MATEVILLLGLFAQLLFSAGLKSPTIDEPNHLTRGYAYLKTGDLRLSRVAGHPPLFNLLCAWPLFLLDDLSLPLHSPNWVSGFRNAFATEFIFGGAVLPDRLFFLGRLPVILTTVCLAALAARWAGELYGTWGSVVALLLCALDPNLIAHGRLATTDIGMTLFFLLSAYLFWRFLRRPSLTLLVLSGVALGLAQGVKFSAVLLLPLLGLLGLIEVANPKCSLTVAWLLRNTDKADAKARGTLGRLVSGLLALSVTMAAAVLLAGLTLWVIYGFQIGRPSGWPIAVPAPDYVEGLRGTWIHASATGHPAFLMGRRSTRGWWYYFPVAFVLKTPLPALIALLSGWVSNVWKRFSRAEWPLLLIPVAYFGLSMRGVLTIGYRHLLPILPFLWIYVGRIGPLLRAASTGQGRRWVTVGATALGLWLAVGTLSVAPHYLAYFNALAGGADGGWRYLVDSNLDWGQDLPALKAYLDQLGSARGYGAPRVYLSWFGTTYPHLYGQDFEYRLLPSHFAYPYPRDAARSSYNPLYPPPGLYAIGATNLQGVGLAAGDVFARFRERDPLARVGHSNFVYEVTDSPASVNPTCVSDLRFKDLTAETTHVSLGRGPGPVKWFDHATSFILPATGDPVYVLPTSPLEFVPDWQAAFLTHAEVVHRQAKEGRYPAATVYHFDRISAEGWLAEALPSISIAPISWSPAVVFDASAEVHSLSSPVSFDHGLELLGYLLVSGKTLRPGQALELVTVWRSTAEMPAAVTDLRVFAHLLDDHSQVRGAEDRLGLHPPTWEPGDVLIQYHRLPLAIDAEPGTYQIELGFYTYITMRRLAVRQNGTSISDRLLLQPIEVLEP